MVSVTVQTNQGEIIRTPIGAGALTEDRGPQKLLSCSDSGVFAATVGIDNFLAVSLGDALAVLPVPSDVDKVNVVMPNPGADSTLSLRFEAREVVSVNTLDRSGDTIWFRELPRVSADAFRVHSRRARVLCVLQFVDDRTAWCIGSRTVTGDYEIRDAPRWVELQIVGAPREVPLMWQLRLKSVPFGGVDLSHVDWRTPPAKLNGSTWMSVSSDVGIGIDADVVLLGDDGDEWIGGIDAQRKVLVRETVGSSDRDRADNRRSTRGTRPR